MGNSADRQLTRLFDRHDMLSRKTKTPRQRPPGNIARPAEGGADAVARTDFTAAGGCLRSHAPVPVLPFTQQGTHMRGGWPLRDFIELGALPSAVPCARLRTRQLLWEWGAPAQLRESAELLVTELVTNAIKAARSIESSEPVRLWLMSDRICALILVWDANPQPPIRMATDGDAETGRGLVIVEAVSKQWNCCVPAGVRGKVVWTLCAE